MNNASKLRESIQADISRVGSPNNGNLAEKQAFALGVIERARATGDAYLVVRALQPAAEMCELSGEFAKCYGLTLEAESLATEHDFAPELAFANVQLGRCLVAVGHFDRALTRLYDGLKMFRALGNSDGELSALQALAGFHLAQGQYRNMFVYLEESLQLIRPDESTQQTGLFHAGIAEGHAHYAAALAAQGHLFEASTQCDRALGLLPRRERLDELTASTVVEARLLDTVARLHLLRGHVAVAARCATTLLRAGRGRGAMRVVANGCDRLADVRAAQGRHAKAIRWLMRSHRCWQQLDMHREQVVALDRLSDAHAALGQYAEALNDYKAARRIEDEARSAQASLRSEMMVIELNAERSQRAEQEALEHTNRLAGLGRMVACIAHEVTQPLSAIRLVAENAAADATHSPESLARIVRLVDQTMVYVQHLKRFTRRDRVHLEPVRLSTIVDEAMAVVEPKRKSCNITLTLDVDNDAAVLADPVRTNGVLVNLLCNAFDAVAGTGRTEVSLAARVVGDRGVLEVRDHGYGLSADAVTHLFEPFYTTKPVGKGSGLGLTLSMDLARRMGAYLKGTNHPDGGAVFTLDMALARPAPDAVAPDRAETVSSGCAPTETAWRFKPLRDPSARAEPLPATAA